jgi:hypothetical protein
MNSIRQKSQDFPKIDVHEFQLRTLFEQSAKLVEALVELKKCVTLLSK